MNNLSGATTAVFTISLSAALETPVSVAWNTKDGTAKAGTDYEAASGSVTFEPGVTTQQIQVVVYGRSDGDTETRTFGIELYPPENAILDQTLTEISIQVTDGEGVAITSIVVATGPRGLKGDPGLSTYELAKLQGYEGTLAQWLQEEVAAGDAAKRAETAASNAETAELATKQFAEDAQNISDEHTYYPTTGDPDGTIAGLAGTAEGELFRVFFGGSTVKLFRYYRKVSGAAVFMGDYPSILAYTQLRDAIGAVVIGIDQLTGANYINPTDGTLVSNVNWKNSPYISVLGGQQINLTAVAVSDQQANIAFYDVNQAFLSSGATSALNILASKTFTAPANGFIRVSTRYATSPEFQCEIMNKVSSSGTLDRPAGASSLESLLAVAKSKATVRALPATKVGDIASGYINNAGAVTPLAGLRYRSLALASGETAYFSGYCTSGATVDAISAVLFKPDSGAIQIVKGLPRTTNANSRYSGEFTASVPGTIYINLYSDPLNTAEPYGHLLAGVTNETIIQHPDNISATDVGSRVLSSIMARRDQECLIANGSAVSVSDSAEVILDQVLYNNGAYQTLAGGSAQGQWCIKNVPVRKGDKVRFYGYFLTSTTSILTYLSQLDEQKKYISELYGMAPSAGYRTVEVVATQDGYIAVRVQLINAGSPVTHTLSRIGPTYFSGGDGPDAPSDEGAICTPSMEKLPIQLDTTWLYNSPSHQQNGIVTAGNYQYVVCVAEGRKPHIMQRSIFGGPWTRFDLSTIAGNPFASPNALDGHNSFSIGVTKNGYILVSGNMHADPCRCAISNNPHDITSWTAITYSSAAEVTYPKFLMYPDGTLQAFWREGTSGNGTYHMSTFNDTTKQFGTNIEIISAPDGGNPYEQTIVVDNAGVLHICYGIRVSSASADSNSGMYYAKSTDKGQTFKNAAGTLNYAIPLNPANSERPVVVNQGSGYVNQNGACADLNGRFHTVYWQIDANGYTQIIHLWFDGTSWNTETASDFTYTEVTSGSLLEGTSSLPLICCTRHGKIYIVYRTTEDGKAGQVRVIDVTTPGAPKDHLLARFDVYKSQLSINVREIMSTGVLAMMLYYGNHRYGGSPFTSECAWLFQAQLP
ncbi:BNR-4 repeat-containing protein [Leclercia sp.]|uniref:BNR-4 repeat-containing protein n=1 Tax=Leclercia sp. TaxID=1898428 RepID=UPI0028BD7A92|nr:BNR-4 repeat-containing protein [Leclercia sp.]